MAERLFVLLLVFSIFFTLANSDSINLQLIHRRHAPRIPALRRALHRDQIRLRAISRKSIAADLQIQGPAHYTGDGTAGEMAIYSAADFGVGQYFVAARAGTPAQRVALIADTGSDLSWIKCRYRCPSGKWEDATGSRFFLADRSVSFKTVSCGSSRCKLDLSSLFSLSRCPSPLDPCAYDYRYSDGSSAQGIFADETVVLKLINGDKARLPNVLIGCTDAFSGQSFRAADGVLGLGYSNHSFAVSAAARFGGRFSYCLVDHLSPQNKSSYMTFGPRRSTYGQFNYTDLFLGVIGSFYAVKVRGISIGGALLQIPSETWDTAGVGGVIIDSGTSLTALSLPAYGPVVAALKKSLLKFGNLDLDLDPLKYCFNSTGFDESAVPRFAIHFGDGARFEPPVKSYIIDAAPGVKCLGFVAAAWPGVSVIGNILQQNHLWEFDLVNRRLGFAASSCTQV